MVWGGISLEGRTALRVLARGSLTAIRYRDEILRPLVRPYAGAVGPGFLLMQDNARPHVAGACQQFLRDEGTEAMDWPARSPDLNPTEDIWDIMSRSIHQSHVAPQTVQELADALVQVWEEIPQETIRHLIRSMPRLVLRQKERRQPSPMRRLSAAEWKRHFRIVIQSQEYRKSWKTWELSVEFSSIAGTSRILVNFYRCTIESILTNGISVWYKADYISAENLIEIKAKLMAEMKPTQKEREPVFDATAEVQTGSYQSHGAPSENRTLGSLLESAIPSTSSSVPLPTAQAVFESEFNNYLLMPTIESEGASF
ncbi:hypothetical protein NFI96_001274 [Prochilodus magdalenae]|nr:hypothetical protein NFI96_001274 [Prochilodus magdalenae]